jgi:hypothetical protein
MMAEYKVEIKTDRDSAIIGQTVTLSAVITENESEINQRLLYHRNLSLRWEVSPESVRLLIDAEEPHIALLDADENSTPSVYRITLTLLRNNEPIATASCSITLNEYSRCSVSGVPYKPDSFVDAVHSYIAADPDTEDDAITKLLAKPSALFQGFETLLLYLAH